MNCTGYPSVILVKKKILWENKVGRKPYLHREVEEHGDKKSVTWSKQPKLELAYSGYANDTSKPKEAINLEHSKDKNFDHLQIKSLQ